MSSPSSSSSMMEKEPSPPAEETVEALSLAEGETQDEDATKAAESMYNDAVKEENEGTVEQIDMEEKEDTTTTEEDEQKINQEDTILAASKEKEGSDSDPQNDESIKDNKENDGSVATVAETAEKSASASTLNEEIEAKTMGEDKKGAEEKETQAEETGKEIQEEAGGKETGQEGDRVEKNEAKKKGDNTEGASTENHNSAATSAEKNQTADSNDKNKQAAPDSTALKSPPPGVAALKSPPPASAQQNPPNNPTSLKPPPPPPPPMQQNQFFPGVQYYPSPSPLGTQPTPLQPMPPGMMMPPMPPPVVPLPPGFVPVPNFTFPPPQQKPPMKPGIMSHLKIMKQPPLSKESKESLRDGILARISAFITLVRQGQLHCHPNESWWLIQDSDKLEIPRLFDKYDQFKEEEKAEKARKKEEAERERARKKEEVEREKERRRQEREKAKRQREEAKRKRDAETLRKEDYERRKKEEIERWSEMNIVVVENEEEVKKLRKKGIISVATTVTERPLRKRGRPRKVDVLARQQKDAATKQKEDATTKQKEVEKSKSASPTTPTPKKRGRGRPPKNKEQQEQQKGNKKSAAPTPAKSPAKAPAKAPTKAEEKRGRGRRPKKFSPVTFWEQLGYTHDHMILAFSTDPTTHTQNKLWAQNLFKMPIAYNGLRVEQHRNAIFVTVTPAPWKVEKEIHTIPRDDKILFWGWDKEKTNKLKCAVANMSLTIKGAAIEAEYEKKLANVRELSAFEKEREIRAVAILQRQAPPTRCSKRKITPPSRENQTMAEHLHKRPYWTEAEKLPSGKGRKKPRKKGPNENDHDTLSNPKHIPSALNIDMGAEDDLKDFPLLASLGIRLGFGFMDIQQRQNILRELVGFHRKHNKPIKFAQMGGASKECFLVCFSKRDTFSQFTTKNSMEELLDGISTSRDTSADILCEYLAKKRPASFIKFHPFAKEHEDKKGHWGWHTHRPEDFKMHDESDENNEEDVLWNVMYTHLLHHKDEVGHCNVPQPTGSFGEWVSKMRIYKKRNDPKLTPKRIELLEKIGFEWVVKKPNVGVPGDPRMNLALAAKLRFPMLTYPEALLIGGHSREEAYQHPGGKRDTLCRRKRQFRRGVQSKVRNEVQRLMFMLEKENGVEELFGKSPYYEELIVQKSLRKENSPFEMETSVSKEEKKEETLSTKVGKDSKDQFEDTANGRKEEQKQEKIQKVEPLGVALAVPTIDGNLDDDGMERFDASVAVAASSEKKGRLHNSYKSTSVDDGELDRFDTAVAAATTIENDSITDDKTKKRPVNTDDGGLERFDDAVAAAAASENDGVTDDEIQARRTKSLNRGNNVAIDDKDNDECTSSKQHEQRGIGTQNLSGSMAHHVAAAAIDRMASFHPTHVARGPEAIAGRLNEPFATASGSVFHDPAADVFNMVAGGANGSAAPYHYAGSGGGTGNTYPYASALAAAPAPAAPYDGMPMQMNNTSGTSPRGAPSRKSRSGQPFSEGGS